ncbi:MAG TPA: 3'-5' exonuclease [Chitinophagaceae bacterium]|nr:3'-5' exonuclease [Chitinophagaceae bacterium]HPH32885.1 3'-5' exonuclease [Chitinophagaceae bacterium]
MKEMNLTEEQKAILATNTDIAVNAVAGSGKTSTMIEYAASRPAGCRILYLAFNKSVKLEAVRKFAARGLNNVTVETAHSLAYRYIMRGNKYILSSQGYKTHQIAEVLSLTGDGARHTEFILANHISKFITYFCNSDKAKVQDLNYLDTVKEANAKKFVHAFYRVIEEGTRHFLAKMDKAEIEITHDFYLKKFQLSAPVLPYDYILFDEGQDASAAMLDVFLKQPAIKVIVGDTHQQIYGWRYAINSLSKTPFATLNLSTSFRFPADIAALAMGVLSMKDKLGTNKPIPITGKGKTTKTVTKATIGRTNLGLLLNAINYITDNRKVKHIYFEGNIHSYTYADEGASLYDVLSLYNGSRERIRDKLIGSMNTMDELEEYIESTEDAQLGMMMEIVNEYGNEIPRILKNLKDLHTGDEDRLKAEMIFSTVHRAKGMEYDTVHLVNDFISEQKLDRVIKEAEAEKQTPDKAKLNEEINLLYVAVTRTRHKLYVPDSLVPADLPASAHIIKLRKENNDNTFGQTSKVISEPKKKYIAKTPAVSSAEKKYSVEKSREVNKDAYKPWTASQDDELIYLYESDNSFFDMAAHFGRTRGAIISRLRKLGYYTE